MIITMAGKGSRFKEVGVTVPKHQIIIDDRPMFDWAMQSLESFFNEEFIFITQSGHSTSDFLLNACDRLGINSYQEVTLDSYTSGQAATALAADDWVNANESIAIYNIDTYIESGEIEPTDISGDGFIPIFEAPGERWSFVKENKQGNVQKVSEKEKISNKATIGFYYFDQWSYFVDAFEMAASDVKSEYGETYVAPLYNHLINKNRSVHTHRIERDKVHVLGTPRDLRNFYPEFDFQSTN